MQLRQIRKSAYVILTLLLVCLVMVISTSYAWFSISRVPEVKGVDTNIGANGSLEIALLSDITYTDTSLIRSKIGDSSVIEDLTVSNLAWGNVIDLKDESYGLEEVSLVPARLNVIWGEEEQIYVGTNLLKIPEYGFDGRFSEFMENAVSAVFDGDEFVFDTGGQSYGVRGIGTLSSLSLQQTAMAEARASVRMSISEAESWMEYFWSWYGEEFFNVFARQFTDTYRPYASSDVWQLISMAEHMQGILEDIDWALRYGIVGYGSAVLSVDYEFSMFRNAVLDRSMPLSEIAVQLSMPLPEQYAEWISLVEADQKEMENLIDEAYDLLDMGSSYTWSLIEPIWNKLLDLDNAYLGVEKLSSLTSFVVMGDVELTIGPEAGVMADIADFVGNYTGLFEGNGYVMEVKSVSVQYPPYLQQLNAQLYELRPGVIGRPTYGREALEDVFGYVVDLAFRSNAECDLLLQTESVAHVAGVEDQTVTANPENAEEQNGMQAVGQDAGSFMQFVPDGLSKEQTLELMDAIRVGFLDNHYNLLCVAKLNTSNYEETEEGLKAPLYLYDYEILNDGAIRMGERKVEENKIIALPKNAPTVLSTVVWLDGDYVGNSQVNSFGQKLIGTLNLQFSSSATLVPSGELMIDKIEQEKNEGQE